jgi:2-hydroxycyclohexanecarboxyl-CoA dehydrogenase
MSRVAFVTGGGSGIGRGIALALGEAGYRVAVADVNGEAAQKVADEITTVGGDATPIPVDITDGASVATAVAETEQRIGPVEVLVNCAGWDDFMNFVDTTEEFWDKVVQLNYVGMLRVTHAIVPGMIERGFGRIVNIGSDAGRVGSSLEAVYSGAKGGTIAFTKTLAREVATSGITANTVCPGPTDTPALRRFADDSGQDADKVIGGMTRAVPMKRLGRPEDVAVAVAFFASDAAEFITGQTLSVSGGLTMA